MIYTSEAQLLFFRWAIRSKLYNLIANNISIFDNLNIQKHEQNKFIDKMDNLSAQDKKSINDMFENFGKVINEKKYDLTDVISYGIDDPDIFITLHI